jgi:transglutaminase-like putative cysteine protease
MTLLSILLSTAAVLSAHAAPPTSDVRSFTIRYTATIGPLPEGEGPVDVFLPLPKQGDAQEVPSVEVKSNLAGTEGTEARFGNRFWHGHADKSDGKPIEVAVMATIRRRPTHGPPTQPGPNDYSADERARLNAFLLADKRVPLRGGPLEKIDAELTEKLGDRAKDPLAVARTIYDYVVDNMEYKKVGTGWGNGDTFWACSAKYGNCTDFHALFLSLARRRGIPARFEMGFPIPADRSSGTVAGYHCWVEFWLPGRGWVPIDASEAQKHPEQREALFGSQPADRVQLSEGRDLTLPGLQQELNYFIYPQVEVAGKASKAVAWKMEYQDVK